MLAILGAVAAFVAVAAIVSLIAGAGSTRAVERRIGRLKTVTEETELESVLRTDTGTFPFLSGLMSGSWSETTRLSLARAGSGLKVSEYLLTRFLLGGIAAFLTVMLFGGTGVSILIAMVTGLIGFMLPAMILGIAQSRRVDKINHQLAEALSLIANALRSGFAFTQAVELAVRQVDPPIRDELSRYLRDVSLGASSEVALQELADRTASYDLEIMVATILVQRNTGGNLSEILDNVAETIRERERIAGEIRALTASQRLTGLILSFYPIFLAVIFSLLAPDLMRVLIEEEMGRGLLVVAVCLQLIGILTIRRILRPEI